MTSKALTNAFMTAFLFFGWGAALTGGAVWALGAAPMTAMALLGASITFLALMAVTGVVLFIMEKVK